MGTPLYPKYMAYFHSILNQRDIPIWTLWECSGSTAFRAQQAAVFWFAAEHASGLRALRIAPDMTPNGGMIVF